MDKTVELRIIVNKDIVKSMLTLTGKGEVANDIKPHYDISIEEMAKQADESPTKLNVMVGGIIAGIANKEFEESKKKDNA